MNAQQKPAGATTPTGSAHPKGISHTYSIPDIAQQIKMLQEQFNALLQIMAIQAQAIWDEDLETLDFTRQTLINWSARQ